MAPSRDSDNTADLAPRAREARRKRIVLIVVITAIVEAALFTLVHFGPAMASLVQPVYFIVLVVCAATIWHAMRRHPGHDRRRSDRRSAR